MEDQEPKQRARGAPHRKYKLQKDFLSVCETLDYDPATELVIRRNDLVDEADRYEALADEEASLTNPDQEKIDFWLEQVDYLRDHVERIDFKLLPFLYGRKSSHTVEAGDGTSLLEAFAKVASNSLRKPMKEAPLRKPPKEAPSNGGSVAHAH
jgi:hypothetical protein